MIPRPKPNEYPTYFETYIKLVKEEDALKTLDAGILNMQVLLSDIPEEKENFAYATNKWTVKEVIGHIIDTERIMTYRALRFARGDGQELPGFDENSYVKNAHFDKRTLIDMAHEFSQMRQSNIALFKSFDEEALNRKGIANKNLVSVRALAFIIPGHQLHHMSVIKERYLK
ncbi:MAG: DinB family protein [Bacteroidia bacterium]|nr:DinB family protein [Bacteroidia bacterium]